jgi:hypothetical protein
MAMSRLSIPLAVLVCGLALAGCAPKKMFVVNPQFASGERTVGSVAIIAPRMDLKCEKLGGERDCGGIGRDLESVFEEVLTTVAADHGYRLVSARTSPEELAADPDRQAWLNELQDRLAAEGPPEAEPPEPSLGQAVTVLAEGTGADALLVSNGRGELHTGGMQALAFSADTIIGLLTAAVCVIGPIDFCVSSSASTNFYSQTVNNLDYQVVLADGRDGTVLVQWWGRTNLDDFVASGAPGKKHYADQLENFRQRLRERLSKELDAALQEG